MLFKSTLRTVKKSLGRYLAILAIIALGVGFFAGLRVSEKTMLKTADGYIFEKNLYDFRLVSTLGFAEDDVEAFSDLEGVDVARGSVSADLIVKREDGSDAVLHAHTLLDRINGVEVLHGRLPSRDDECVLDSRYAGADAIGTKMVLSENNSDETLDTFTYDEYTVVGIIDASEYINFQRGTTALSGGTVLGFAYIPEGGFNTDYYTEIFLSIPTDAEMYSKEYEAAVDRVRPLAEALLKERADIRFDFIYNNTKAMLYAGRAELEAARKHPSAAIPEIKEFLDAKEAELSEGYANLAALERPTVYTLDRNANFGYVGFENDIKIVSGIARVFPIFFFLVAALVCITTMTRMVSE